MNPSALAAGRWPRSRELAILHVVAAGFAVVMAAYVLGPVHHNALALTDDHEIALWVGARDRLPATEWLRVFLSTEVTNPGAIRFRPVYYAVRILEAVLFGKDPALWYASRATMLAAGVYLLVFSVLRWVARTAAERTVALAGLVVVLSRIYWAEIYGRLGPGEAYGIVGVALALPGFLALLVERDRRPWAYWIAVVGSLVAAGSKENLLLLLVPLAIVAIRDRRAAPASGRVALALGLLLLVGDALWVLRIASLAGADIYGNSTSVASRAAVLAAFFARPEAQRFGGAGLALAAALVVLRLAVRRPLGAAPRQLAALAAVLLVCTAAALTQFVFYAGKLPMRGHYDFPYLLFFDAALVFGVVVATRLVSTATARVPFASAVHVGLAVVAAVLIVRAVNRPLKEVREHACLARQSNLAFEERFARALDTIQAEGARGVVLYTHRGWAWEQVLAVSRHLTARGVQVPVHVVLAPDAAERSPPGLEQALLASLRDWSARGFEGLRPTPADLHDCFSFGYYGPPLATCRAGVSIWPPERVPCGRSR